MKKMIAILLAAILALSWGLTATAGGADVDEMTPVSTVIATDAKSVILVDAGSGSVLYEQNADEKTAPASVTKIMTLLLTMEAIDEGKLKMDDMLTVSDVAADMGGSQVYLEPGEQMTVHDLLKCVAVASANDAATVLAEAVAGSVDAFVARMNERAGELGMRDTNFENPTGLDDGTVNHTTTARDIAAMSRELLRHDAIFEFTTTWMDTVRDGSFGLTNTNRLVRFYRGCNGLKTGYTSKAKYCISACAKRDGLQLIAVVLGSATRDNRNQTAKELLDYGFANFAAFVSTPEIPESLSVTGGMADNIPITAEPFSALLPKGKEKSVRTEIILPDAIAAPIAEGDPVGKIEYYLDENCIGSTDIRAAGTVAHISFLSQFLRLLKSGLYL